jgi:hypothetical protein
MAILGYITSNYLHAGGWTSFLNSYNASEQFYRMQFIFFTLYSFFSFYVLDRFIISLSPGSYDIDNRN